MEELILKTKQDYVNAHKKLWNWIINYMRIHKIKYNIRMKEDGYKILWSNYFSITDFCFGCLYAHDVRVDVEAHLCNTCLFDIDLQFRNEDGDHCLNNLYFSLFCSTDYTNSMSIAKKIRDFPIKL